MSVVERTLITKAEQPAIIAEGIIKMIDLGTLAPESRSVMEDCTGICVKFIGVDKFFINIFDYRSCNKEFWFDQEKRNEPCLGTMRRGKCLYVALADLDDPRCDIGSRDRTLFLFHNKSMEKESYRVATCPSGKVAIHPATGICLAELRIPKAV